VAWIDWQSRAPMLAGVVISSLYCDSETICLDADFATDRGATCRVTARGRRTLSVIEDLGLVALAARTVIAFELGFRLTARQGRNAPEPETTTV
jgi:hypothetical protein